MKHIVKSYLHLKHHLGDFRYFFCSHIHGRLRVEIKTTTII